MRAARVQASPLPTGDCKVISNMAQRFGSGSAVNVGVFYGPTSICLGLPNGSLGRGQSSGSYSTKTACFAIECSGDGSTLTLLLPNAVGDSFVSYPCPAGGLVSLGPADGFADNVRLHTCCDQSSATY